MLLFIASVAERFSWVSGALQEHLSQCARRNLRASVTDEFYVQSAMQPRAGYDLSRASSAIAQASQLRTVASTGVVVRALQTNLMCAPGAETDHPYVEHPGGEWACMGSV